MRKRRTRWYRWGIRAHVCVSLHESKMPLGDRIIPRIPYLPLQIPRLRLDSLKRTRVARRILGPCPSPSLPEARLSGPMWADAPTVGDLNRALCDVRLCRVCSLVDSVSTHCGLLCTVVIFASCGGSGSPRVMFETRTGGPGAEPWNASANTSFYIAAQTTPRPGPRPSRTSSAKFDVLVIGIRCSQR